MEAPHPQPQPRGSAPWCCRYGEKQVKGSPYPRSYYKCSYPGCLVKKIIERDPKTGHVSEAVTRVGDRLAGL